MIQAHPVGGAGLKAYGTDVLSTSSTRRAALPTRNFQDGLLPDRRQDRRRVAGGEAAAPAPRAASAASSAAAGSPRSTTRTTQGVGEGPEYETAWAFGADCGIDDLDAITKANFLCNEYGIDTISMGSTIACAMELFESGDHHDQGHRRRRSSRSATPRPWSRWCARPARARASAPSSRRARTGSPRATATPSYSMTCKKQEMPAYDPRGVQGIGLNYATGNRGGCHVRGYTIAIEVLQQRRRDGPARHRGQGRAGHHSSRTSPRPSTPAAPACSRPSASAAPSWRRCSRRSPAWSTRSTSS